MLYTKITLKARNRPRHDVGAFSNQRWDKNAEDGTEANLSRDRGDTKTVFLLDSGKLRERTGWGWKKCASSYASSWVSFSTITLLRNSCWHNASALHSADALCRGYVTRFPGLARWVRLTLFVYRGHALAR